VFSHTPLTDGEAERYWATVDAERRGLRKASGFWRGALATVSLRSLFRPMAPEPGRRTRFAEGGRRRAEPARPMP
jgi:hypothetical protein